MMHRVVYLTVLVCCASACPSWPQQWQWHEISRFDSTQLRGVGSSVDSAGNVHLFVAAYRYEDTVASGVYYMRVSPQGDVLTDVVRLDTAFSSYPDLYPMSLTAVGDGVERAWGVWYEGRLSDPASWGLFMAGRRADGCELFSTTSLGEGVNEYIDGAYRGSDETMHVVRDGPMPSYYRFTAAGETLIWNHRVPETRMSISPRMAIGPDGTPWGAWRFSTGQPADIMLARFGADTSIATFYPFGYLTGQRWGIYDFAVDMWGRFHFLVYHDTTQLSYCLLDSTFRMLEWRTLQRQPDNVWASLALDSAGQCLVVWRAQSSVFTAFRTADGEWTFPPRLMRDSVLSLDDISVHSASDGRWVFTAEVGFIGAVWGQVDVFAYGFPPSAVSGRPDRSVSRIITVYPNPFNCSFALELPSPGYRDLRMFDVLGRCVFTMSIAAASSRITVTDAALLNLPSGMYVLTLTNNLRRQTIKVFHIR